MFKTISTLFILCSLVSAQTDTMHLKIGFKGDVTPNLGTVTITYTASNNSRGSDLSGISCSPQITYLGPCSNPWTGKITPKKNGFIFTPKDTTLTVRPGTSPIIFSAKDTAHPVIDIIFPDSNSTIKIGQKNYVNVICYDATGLLKSIKIEYSTDYGNTWILIPSKVPETKGLAAGFIIVGPLYGKLDSFPFTPTKIAPCYKIRTTAQNYFNLTDTNYRTINIAMPPIKIQVINHQVRPISYSKSSDIYNLLGKKIINKKAPTLIIMDQKRNASLR